MTIPGASAVISTQIRKETFLEQSPIPGLSIVVPLVDEAESLEQLHDELSDAIVSLKIPSGVEMIYIDDGSSDSSARVLEEIHRRDARVTVINFRRNFGKSAALAAGFELARGEYIVTLDADLQDVPGEIGNVLEPLIADRADLVSGWKTPRHDPPGKRLPSLFYNWVVRRATGIPLHDFNCGLKAYRREVLAELQLYGEMHRYVPVLAHFRGFRIEEVQVQHRPRQHGSTKFGFERYFRGFFDLLTVLFLNHYTRRPLHLFGWIGMLAFGVGFLIDFYLAVLKLGFGEPIGHRPLLTLGVLLMVIGGLFVVFGLLGEMIAHQTRVSLDRQGRESMDYSIRSILRHDQTRADD